MKKRYRLSRAYLGQSLIAWLLFSFKVDKNKIKSDCSSHKKKSKADNKNLFSNPLGC